MSIGGARDGRAARILVVDDEPVVAAILADTPAADGHRVATARDGVGALGRLRAEGFDAVLSDIHMPGLDGIGLYRAVADMQPALTHHFVLVTGSSLTPETQQFLAETGVLVLEKPLDLREVRSVVRRLLGR